MREERLWGDANKELIEGVVGFSKDRETRTEKMINLILPCKSCPKRLNFAPLLPCLASRE
jgi:hypothetical protein